MREPAQSSRIARGDFRCTRAVRRIWKTRFEICRALADHITNSPAHASKIGFIEEDAEAFVSSSRIRIVLFSTATFDPNVLFSSNLELCDARDIWTAKRVLALWTFLNKILSHNASLDVVTIPQSKQRSSSKNSALKRSVKRLKWFLTAKTAFRKWKTLLSFFDGFWANGSGKKSYRYTDHRRIMWLLFRHLFNQISSSLENLTVIRGSASRQQSILVLCGFRRELLRFLFKSRTKGNAHVNIASKCKLSFSNRNFWITEQAIRNRNESERWFSFGHSKVSSDDTKGSDLKRRKDGFPLPSLCLWILGDSVNVALQHSRQLFSLIWRGREGTTSYEAIHVSELPVPVPA